MNLAGINATANRPENVQNGKLQQACDQVEGLFLKMLLKEGMQGMLENAEGHTASALGYALEQTAEEVASEGDLGIADRIYEQLSANL